LITYLQGLSARLLPLTQLEIPLFPRSINCLPARLVLIVVDRGALKVSKQLLWLNMFITFKQFKEYFEFAFEVTSVVGGIGTVIYKVNSLNAIWKVA
jgi:hypothetical protein